MTDVAEGFLQAVSAFCATRLVDLSKTTFKDAGSVIDSVRDDVPDNTKPAVEKVKKDVEDASPTVKALAETLKTAVTAVKTAAAQSTADAEASDFTVAMAGRIATRTATALVAVDTAFEELAKELAKKSDGTVDDALRTKLLGIWDPWRQPFKDLGAGAGKLLDSFGTQVLGVEQTTKKLGETLLFDAEKFRLSAKLVTDQKRDFRALRLNSSSVEAFLSFARREFPNPPEDRKPELVKQGEKWFYADTARLGLVITTTIEPGLQQDPLLKKVMPGSSEPKTITPTTITLDSADGLSLGDGTAAGNEKAVLPVQLSAPMAELREVALAVVRNEAREVTGLELTSILAARLAGVVGMQVGGVGATIALDGQPAEPGMFPWDVSPRWPDAIGLRVKTAAVTGGGYLERKTRTYGEGDAAVKLVEFSGVLQLEVLKVGVYAIGILSPDPFSLVLVMGVRFPTAVELSFGFTLNGIGGILAIDRRIDTGKLVEGMKSHVLDRMLFPEDPVAEAPGLLDKVAQVFPPSEGSVVVGPIVELGWGSQAKIVEAKLGIVLALPEPKVLVLGAVRVRAPSKVTPVTDFRCEVVGEITGDRLLVIARMHDSKIAGITVSGDLGVLIQWGGSGAFALSVGGWHPAYPDEPAELAALERVTMDLSPSKAVQVKVYAYLAVTAGAVMAGVKGTLDAKIGPAKVLGHLSLDMLFIWVPYFRFEVAIGIGVDVSVWDHSFCKVSFTGTLKGTTPWSLEGTGEIDVWFLPTISLDFGPLTWGDKPPALAAQADPLAMVKQGLAEEEAWKALLPADGDLLVVLDRADVDGLVVHPLAALEVTQSRLPLETHVDRVGSAGVKAHRVALDLPTTSSGPVKAVSTVRAPFAPGQFLALEGEELLGRAGFEDLPSGCRLSAATTPVHGPSEKAEVRWRTYVRDAPPRDEDQLDLRLFTDVLLDQSLVGRRLAERTNPYLPRTEAVQSRPGAVRVLPRGVAEIRLVDDATTVLGDLGLLGATEAARVVDVVNRSGAAHVAAVTAGGMA